MSWRSPWVLLATGAACWAAYDTVYYAIAGSWWAMLFAVDLTITVAVAVVFAIEAGDRLRRWRELRPVRAAVSALMAQHLSNLKTLLRKEGLPRKEARECTDELFSAIGKLKRERP